MQAGFDHPAGAAERERPTLRFITCGSVDDGKSTLIGRLLYDSQMVPDDQLAALAADSRVHGTTGGGLDFALLVDGLAAEREQGITIDVAYRYFATRRRRFIVADTPGHEQYTRNMATGASTADLAVVLVDARQGVVEQTRRHSFILGLFGVRHAVLAVNKMDLVGYDPGRFAAIAEAFQGMAARCGFAEVTCIPVVARSGDNVLVRSEAMPWYGGPTLLAHLETVEVGGDIDRQPFRMAVQWVNRPDAEFRGYSGRIAAGTVKPGDRVAAHPSGRAGRVARIATADGDLDQAVAGQSVTLVLADPIDVGRGDVLAAVGAEPLVGDQLTAHLLWLDEPALAPGRRLSLKMGAATIGATVAALQHRVGLDGGEPEPTAELAVNEIGVVRLGLDRPVACEPYGRSRELGGFILIDPTSRRTVAAGVVDAVRRTAADVRWQDLKVTKAIRAGLKQQRPCVLWFTGLSGAGKSTIANLVEQRLAALGRHSYVLDGDNLRHGLNRNLGFTVEARVENIRRVAEVAKLFVDAGLIVLSALISPFRAEREMARALLATGEFVEIHVATPLAVCEARDPKGLYARARAGQIVDFTGIDAAYEPPEAPQIRLDTTGLDPAAAAERVIAYLRDGDYI